MSELNRPLLCASSDSMRPNLLYHGVGICTSGKVVTFKVVCALSYAFIPVGHDTVIASCEKS